MSASVTVSESDSKKTVEAVPDQRTMAETVRVSGVGLHLGQQTTVCLMPAEAGEGRYFVRSDLAGELIAEAAEAIKIPAAVGSVVQTRLSTELGVGQAEPAQTVRTVEHLLAALVALELDNVRIEIDGPELPLLDGSAKGWIDAIAPIGTTPQSVLKRVRPALSTPITVHEGDVWVAAFPSPQLRFSYGIDFDLAAIGNQWYSWAPDTSSDGFASGFARSFTDEIAPARTFGLAHQIDYLRSQGLIKGGNLENALVCGPDGWLNPPLRFENEPARHKMLDLIGDLGLLGCLPRAHYVAYKASHTLHVALAKQLDKAYPAVV